ncbi:MAG: preprotein translocase subunit SecG, partial [Pseudomonadota bacterium]
MENVVLTVHLIIALLLIGVVLLQRSEGGGLGMGGGGNISGRPATTPMAKLTWIFAAAFVTTSVTLTILAARDAASRSVADRVPTTTGAPATGAPGSPPPPTDPSAAGMPADPAQGASGGMPVLPPVDPNMQAGGAGGDPSAAMQPPVPGAGVSQLPIDPRMSADLQQL